MPHRPHPSLTRDLDEGRETPEGMYAAYRYLDRLFADPRPHRRDELAALDPDQLSPRVRYLAWHILILQGRARRTIDDHPNLRPLAREQRTVLDRPIVLSDPPRHSWAYFKRKGIWL